MVPTGSELSDRVPVLLGEAGGKAISLLDCFTLRRDGIGGRASRYQDIHVHEALVGAHVRENEEAFAAAIVTIEHLGSWLTFDGVTKRTDSDDAEGATNRRPADRICAVDGWTITARTQVQPFQHFTERSRLLVEGEVSAYLVLRPPAPVAAHAFHTVVLEMMDLLTLASGEPSGLIDLTLIHKQTIPHPNADGTVFDLEWRVDSYGARTHTARPNENAVADWNFLFTCRDVAFEEIVPRWLAIRRRAPEACNVFFGLRYARPRYTEVRLLLTAVTAETLHSSLYGDETELPADEFDARRARILDSLTDPDEQRWAKEKLRNVPSFRERLLSLTSKPFAAALALVIPDVDSWARLLRSSRDSLAHTGNERTDEDIFHLERSTSAVIALVFMNELSLHPATQERAAKAVLQVPLARAPRSH